MATDVSYFKVVGDSLDYAFNDLDAETRITLLAASLTAEEARAEDAEQVNAAAIAAETTRAQGVEGNLSALTTTDKTSLVAAINELDAGLAAETECVPSTGSANDIIDPGMYYMASGATNLPEGVNGLLLVYRLSNTYVKQVYQRFGTPGSNDGTIYTRESNNTGSTWGAWATHYAAYRAGDSLSGVFSVSGYVTGTSQSLWLEVPLFRPLAADATVTCTAATNAQLRRSAGGYISSSGADLTSYITSVTVRQNGLSILLSNTSGWGETNNTTFTGLITLTLAIS